MISVGCSPRAIKTPGCSGWQEKRGGAEFFLHVEEPNLQGDGCSLVSDEAVPNKLVILCHYLQGGGGWLVDGSREIEFLDQLAVDDVGGQPRVNYG